MFDGMNKRKVSDKVHSINIFCAYIISILRVHSHRHLLITNVYGKWGRWGLYSSIVLVTGFLF